MITLRPYQLTNEAEVIAAWNSGARVVMDVMGCGAGKTATASSLLRNAPGVRFALAHRQELVGQMSVTLAKYEVEHSVVTSSKTFVRYLQRLQTEQTGRPWIVSGSPVIVTGVKTLLNRARDLRSLINQTTRWFGDEGHHFLCKNTWGKAAALFPESARGVLMTATPLRSDGKGLGSHADGIADALVLGPSGRWLIDHGFLLDYKIYRPPGHFDLSRLKVGATGDYTRPSMQAESRRSQIVGDIVETYLKYAPGKRGITFTTDVKEAEEGAKRFQAAGVPAEVLHQGTPERIRNEINARLERGDIKQIVNVDILGEGYDCPAIEVCSMGRPTESFSLFTQQFFRALRMTPGVDRATIFDHVDNVVRMAAKYGLPDVFSEWSLDRRERRSSDGPSDAIPLRVCTECCGVYERILVACPYCGAVPVPAERSGPEQVDGDLTELPADILAQLRGEVARVDASAESVGDRMRAAGAPAAAVNGAMSQHRKRQEAQAVLRDAVAWWAGYHRAQGRPDGEIYRRFYYRFGRDVESAKALGRPDAEALTERIKKDLTDWGVACTV